jgi:hypothetical protein
MKTDPKIVAKSFQSILMISALPPDGGALLEIFELRTTVVRRRAIGDF